MRLLLVNPYIYDFTAFDLWLNPLGILYIAGVIEKYTDCEIFWLNALDRTYPGAEESSHETGKGKFHRELVLKPQLYSKVPRNYSRYGMPLEQFHSQLDKIPQMDMVLYTSLMTYWVEGLQFTFELVKQRFPKAKTLLGGLIPSLLPRESYKQTLAFDYYIRGRGESKILEILRDHGCKVKEHPDFTQIDQIPFPALSLLADHKSLPLLTSRGCPFHCTYCASDILVDKFAERDPQEVYREISDSYHRYGTQHFAIFDDAFLVNKKKRFARIFEKVQANLPVKFHTPNGLHVGEIDKDTAKLLYDSGFKTLRLSMESTRPEILARSSYKVSLDKMVNAIENLAQAGYKRSDLGAYLLFGLPGQQAQDVVSALEFARELGIVPHLSYFSPVPGTLEFINLQQSGILSTPTDLLETNKIHFLYEKSGFSRDNIVQIKDLATVIARENRSKDQ